MTVEERLEKVETELVRARRRERRLLIVGAVVLASIGVLVAAWTRVPEANAQAPAEVAAEVRAQSFVLVDEKGATRAMLVVNKKDEGPALGLFDEKGELRVLLAASKDGPWVSLLDENANNRARLSVDKDGPMLRLFDENEHPRVELIVDNDGPKLYVADEDANVIWSAP